MLAEYRGTEVAVKRVIPPKSSKKGGSLSGSNQGALVGTGSGGSKHSAGNTLATNDGMASWGNLGQASGFGLQSGVGMKSTIFGGKQNEAAQWKQMKKEFMEEMRYLSKLRHPCVTTIMGAVTGKEPMLVMEYMVRYLLVIVD